MNFFPQKLRFFIERFGFPALLLAITLIVRTDWISSWDFLRRFINWPELGGFLKSNSEGFFIAALVAFYLEIVRPNTFSSFFRTQLKTLDSFLAAVGPSSGIRFFLKSVYETQGSNDLSAYIISDKPIIRNCDVRIGLYERTSDLKSVSHQRIDIRYDCQINDVLVLCARNTSIQALLMTIFPEILETVVLDSTDAFEEACQELVSNNPIRIEGKSISITKKSFSKDQRIELLEGLSILEGRDFSFYSSGRISEGLSETRTVSVSFKIPMNRSDVGAAYWMADRPMHVRTIVVDVSGFSDLPNKEFKILRFLFGGDQSSAKLDFANKSAIEISVNRWLVHGQGIAFLWNTRQA
jgi:hypothetical protein